MSLPPPRGLNVARRPIELARHGDLRRAWAASVSWARRSGLNSESETFLPASTARHLMQT
jgi:hypothetical protein